MRLSVSLGRIGVSDFRWPWHTYFEGRLDFNNAIWVYGGGRAATTKGTKRGRAPRSTVKRAGFRPEEVNQPGLVIVGI